MNVDHFEKWSTSKKKSWKKKIWPSLRECFTKDLSWVRYSNPCTAKTPVGFCGAEVVVGDVPAFLWREPDLCHFQQRRVLIYLTSHEEPWWFQDLPKSPSTSTGSQIKQWIYQHKWKRFGWAQRSERMNNNKGRVKNGKTTLMEEPWLVKDSLFSAQPCPLFSFPVSISKKSAPTCLQCDSRLMVQEVEGVCSKELDPSSLLAIWALTQPSSAELTCYANLGKIK